MLLMKLTHQAQHTLTEETGGQGLYEITEKVVLWARTQGADTGMLTVYCRHTSASLTIQENADPDVCLDLNAFFCRLVSEDPSQYRHTAEGPDDMPAHIRSALTDTSLSIPIVDGGLALGTWQGIYLFEHRIRPHRRNIILHMLW
jgi:secondary thiamine-phosphate synthase enzyme